MSKLPDYLAALEYENPADPHNSLFHYAHGTNLNMFQWLRTQPDQLATFSAYMAAATEIQKSSLVAIMTSLLPFNEADCSDDQHDRISLVDVGGGRGQALSKLCQQRPDLKGKLIVQDLPTEIEGREPAEGVQAMSFDFFTPQIIEGAQIYFFTHVFHNWPLGACRQILTNTLPALTPNLSRLFIIDQVVPDSGASAFTAFMDISMMAFGGMERTERQWRELLESVGLTVMRIESPSSDSLSRDSVIEAMLKIWMASASSSNFQVADHSNRMKQPLNFLPKRICNPTPCPKRVSQPHASFRHPQSPDRFPSDAQSHNNASTVKKSLTTSASQSHQWLLQIQTLE